MSPRPFLPPAQSEPLTPDERAWAERLALVGPHAGPHGGPPPELDARILAAAHAAVARRPSRASRRRWPTVVGAAASLVIVVGLAWQLQPLLRSRPSLAEGPAAATPIPRSEGSLSADVLAAADPVAKRAVDSPPPSPAVAAPPRKPASPPAVAPAAPAPRASAQRPTAFGDDAIPPYADYSATTAPRQAASQAAANDAGERATTDARRERAAAAALASAPQPFPAAPEAATGTAMPAAAAAPPPAAAPAASSARRVFAPAQNAPVAATGVATPRPEAEAKPATATAEYDNDNDTLERIDVGDARIDPAHLPVRDDARLEPTAWLQRIRDRRDADDVDGALESLALFRKSHPRIRLPDDLARLER